MPGRPDGARWREGSSVGRRGARALLWPTLFLLAAGCRTVSRPASVREPALVSHPRYVPRAEPEEGAGTAGDLPTGYALSHTADGWIASIDAGREVPENLLLADNPTPAPPCEAREGMGAAHPAAGPELAVWLAVVDFERQVLGGRVKASNESLSDSTGVDTARTATREVIPFSPAPGLDCTGAFETFADSLIDSSSVSTIIDKYRPAGHTELDDCLRWGCARPSGEVEWSMRPNAGRWSLVVAKSSELDWGGERQRQVLHLRCTAAQPIYVKAFGLDADARVGLDASGRWRACFAR